ncbi:DUF4097 and DUF4098 domain-containing protein YvlB [Paenibacillus sp. DS2015]|uniref:DUF4097 family beta strand repeat-containing protein n=1 Tax=Paenibacillus sp. DS2015 TaxID=3373917 RepID=UPI003D203445
MSKKWLGLGFIGLVLLIIGFVGMVFNRFDFGDDLTVYNKKWIFEANTLHTLNLNSDYSAEVNFIESTDGTDSITLDGPLANNTIASIDQAELKNGTFDMNLTDEDTINFINISFQSGELKMTVALSDAKQLQDVSMQFNSDNADINNLTAKNTTIITRSGNLSLESITSEQLLIDVKSGNITGRKIQGNSSVTASSGEIRIDELSGNSTISARSGNIRITQKGANSLDITANSGNVTLTPDVNFAGTFDLKANSGDIQSPDSLRQTDDLIKIRTHSGNITVN